MAKFYFSISKNEPITGPSVRRPEFQCDFAFVFLLVKYGSFVNNIDVTIRGTIYVQSKTFVKLLKGSPYCIHVCFNINVFKVTYN